MAVVTYKGHTKRAVAWFHQSSIFLGVGRRTPWEDESNPPIPSPDDEFSDDVICLKAVEQKYYVIEDDVEGTIFYRNKKYKVLTEEEAWAVDCRWVFVASWLNYDEAPTNVGYRQIGVFTDVVRTADTPSSQYVLLPENIEDYGTLEVIANETVTYRSATKRERLAAIIEF